MDSFLIAFFLAVAVIDLIKCQGSLDFKILATAPSSESKLMEQNIGTSNVLECARMCTWDSPCAFVQYCRNGGMCALYENNANFTTVFDNCSNGKPPITVSRIQPPIPPTDGLSAKYARLNQTGEFGSWSQAEPPVTTEHIQVDFLTHRMTTAIVLKGRAAAEINHQCVTAFKVLYSLDCVNFTYVQDGNGNDKIFTGTFNEDELVTRFFDQPIPARCIRINPTAWDVYPSLRFDVLGC